MIRTAVVAGLVALATVVCLLHQSTLRHALLSEAPGVSHKVQSDYERYLVREVYNDGRRAPHVNMVQQPQIKRAHAGNKGLGQLEHFEATRSKSTLQALRASSKMTSEDYADKRAQGVAPWDYKWRRASGASGLPLEQYNTARKVRTAQLRVAAPLHSHATAHDLPPMPGSFDSLVQEFQH